MITFATAMKKINFIFYLICTCLILSSCNEYQNLLKSTDYELKLKKVKEFYNTAEYVKAAPLFDELIAVYKGTKSLEEIYYFYAYSLYAQEDYLLSEYYFKNFHSYYPKSIYSQDALFMVAFCSFKLSPEDKLDQSNTQKAIDQFQLFMNTYPKSEKVTKANDLVDELRDKLESKAFNSAKLYYDMQQYKSANVAFKNLLNQYPDTNLKEKIFYYQIKSNFEYAEKSIESKKKERFTNTVDLYTEFESMFKDVEYKKEIEKIVALANEYLQKK